MAQIAIRSISSLEILPFLLEYERTMDAVEERAYHLFERRGFQHGRALDDWLEAERELICLPLSYTTDEAGGYRVMTALTGFDADFIEVVASPHDMVIRAFHPPVKLKAILRYQFGPTIAAEGVAASFEAGVLHVFVPKA